MGDEYRTSPYCDKNEAALLLRHYKFESPWEVMAAVWAAMEEGHKNNGGNNATK